MTIPDWPKELHCSITVCDKDGVIIYQNDPAVRQYEKHGSLIGKNPVSYTHLPFRNILGQPAD